MSGRILGAGDFKQAALAGEFEQIEKCVVRGPVSFAGEHLPQGLRLLNVTFEGPVDLSGVRVEGTLDLSGCDFARTLHLDNARIAGDLILDEARVRATVRGNGADGFDLAVMPAVFSCDRIDIGGALRMSHMAVAGFATCKVATIGGDLTIAGCEFLSALDLSGIRCGGDCSIIAGRRVGEPEGRPTKITHWLSLRNARLSGNLYLCGVDIRHDCDIWSSTIEGNAFFGAHENVGSVFGRHLHMAASTIRGNVELCGVAIAGALKLYSSTMGPLRLEANMAATAGPLRGVGCTMGAISARNSTIRGGVLLHHVTVRGSSDQAISGVDLRNAVINAGLSFWPRPDTAKPDEADLDAPALVVGDIDLMGARLGGDCDLTNVTSDGSIILDDAEVRGDVRCDSLVSLLAEASSTGAGETYLASALDRWRSFATDAEEPALVDPSVRPRTSCRRFSMKMANIANDVDLTGLVLRAAPDELLRREPAGVLDAAGLTVAGSLCLFRDAEDAGASRYFVEWLNARAEREDVRIPFGEAVIPGRADLTGAHLGKLSVAGRSFRTRESDWGLDLDGAVIEELSIRPLPVDPPFPVPLSLADTEVKRWDIGETDQSRADRYADLLACDPQFRQSTYLAVERNLRNRGYDDEANAIYQQMKRRSWQPRTTAQRIWSPLRTLFWDKLMGFGTAPGRLGVIILALLILSWGAFYSDARNIAPTTIARLSQRAGAVAEQPREWGFWDSAAIAARTHIPIVSLGVRDEWQLADGGDRPLSLRGTSVRVAGLRPEDYGLIMILLNYLLWPPFVAFLLRRAFRQS